VFLISGTCVPTKPISSIYDEFTELNQHKSYFPFHSNDQKLRFKTADDWRYFLSDVNVDVRLTAAADHIRVHHLADLHSHSTWIVLNNAALSHYLDAESDARLESCVCLHKSMHEYNTKHNKMMKQKYVFPSADEWIPYALVALHSNPLPPSSLSSSSFTHMIIDKCAPSPLMFESWDKAVVMPKHMNASKRSLYDVLSETINTEGVLFFRKVSNAVVFPSNYIQQL
jgi:hypothetical protein